MSIEQKTWDLRVDRSQPGRAHIVSVPDAGALASGQVRLAIERLALTANTVTYAVCGDAPGLKYWQFFPAPEGTGRVPAWGFARVVASTVPEIGQGERFYGFWPIGTHVVVQPVALGARGFVDGALHRAERARIYNTYLRVRPAPADATPAEVAAIEAWQMLMNPLFTTAFLIDDFLAEGDAFGAPRVLLSSASSKTAVATAWMLAQRRATAASREVIGLTSPANRASVDALNCYDQVIPYADLTLLDPAVPTVYVDFAGDAGLRHALHHHLGDALRHDCAVGLTHWEALAARDPAGRPSEPLPGPRPVMFFAPGRWAQREADWGVRELEQRLALARDGFARALGEHRKWLAVVESAGPEAVLQAWEAAVAGRTPAGEGRVLVCADSP